jgi:hypothetical protein
MLTGCQNKTNKDPINPDDGNNKITNNTNDTNKIAPKPTEPKYYTGLERFSLIGRFDTSSPEGIRFSFSNSKIGFRVVNTSKITLSLKDTAYDRLKIEIDGKHELTIVTKPTNNEPLIYELPTKLNNEEHIVYITKITEFLQFSQMEGNSEYVGMSTLVDVVLDNSGKFLAPPEPKKNTVEFIGDSAYTGYAVLDSKLASAGNVCNFYTPETQDATKSVPAYTGTLLNMEIHNISASGKAIFLSKFDGNPNTTLPLIYKKTLPFSSDSNWNFNSRENISIVVIGAGSNDLNNESNGFPNPDGFLKAYTDLIVMIRNYSPKALIVCALTPSAIGTERLILTEYIQKAIKNANDLGIQSVVFYDVWENKPYKSYEEAAYSLSLDYACRKHYGPKGAEYIANQLADFIKKNLK